MYIRMTGGRPDPHPGSEYRIRGEWQKRVPYGDGFFTWMNCPDPRLDPDILKAYRELGIEIKLDESLVPGTWELRNGN